MADDRATAVKAHVQHNSGNNEWYTPAWIIDRARVVLGHIDLDPASSAIANHTVCARRYLTATDDGLTVPWCGSVWLNPPYAQPLITQFITKLIDSADVTEWMTLTNNSTDTKWGQMLLQRATAICFLNKRVRFMAADGTLGKTPLQGQMIAYHGVSVRLFIDTWRDHGTILTHDISQAVIHG